MHYVPRGLLKMFLTLLPAYGRDYKSKKAIIDDLNNNKDFLESTSLKAINKQQFKELNISSFNVRYDQQRKIINIKINDLKWIDKLNKYYEHPYIVKK